MLVKLKQLQNAEPLIVVTEFGIFMLAKLEQPENAPFPMALTESGTLMLVKLLQSANAQSRVDFTGSPSISAGISTSTAVSLQSTICA